MTNIPAISFIRIGNSLIDDTGYLDNTDMLRIWQWQYNKNKKKISYHAQLQKKYQELKNRKL